MTGQISEDGNWIWNGSEWVPITDENHPISSPQNESSSDYFGKIRLGLLTISLILCFIAVTGNSWMTFTEDGETGNFSLNKVSVSGYGSFDYDEFCGGGGVDEQYCSLGTVGLFATTMLWLAIIIGAVTIITYLFDIVDKVPERTRFAFSWGAGALMLIGTLGWVLAKPDFQEFSPTVGLSFWLGLIAGLLALSGEIVNTFFAKQDA
jgi:hypothetical protein